VLTCKHSSTHCYTQAFGAIFQLDVLTDVAAGLLQPVWACIAKEYNYPPPTALQCQRAMGMLPEMAVMREFRWTQVQRNGYYTYAVQFSNSCAIMSRTTAPAYDRNMLHSSDHQLVAL
jgi:hypothetical protein